MAHAGSHKRYSLPRDVFDGAVLGDFASTLGVPGAVAQVICGFIPGLGSVCALRDLIASAHHRQLVDALLNVLSLLPVLGGLSKAAEVIRHIEIVRGAVNVAHHVRHTDEPHRDLAPSAFQGDTIAVSNAPALASLLLSLISPLLVPFFGIGCVTLATAIILGHAGLRIANQRRDAGSRKWMAVTGLIVSYLYLAVALVVTVILGFALYTFSLPTSMPKR